MDTTLIKTTTSNQLPVDSEARQSTSLVTRLFNVYGRYESVFLKVLGVLSAISLWEIAVIVGWANAEIISCPSRIAVAGLAYVTSNQFLKDGRSSGLAFLGGFGLAMAVGILLGFAIGWFKRLEDFLDPIINFLYASPRIALAPLLILWFGIDVESKIAIIFLMSVFPLIINTVLGVHSVDKCLIDLARSFNASGWQIMRTIVIPSSVPFIVTGIRIGLGVALIGVVVSEFVASTAGVGYTIQQAASNFEVDLVFVGLFVIGIVGAALTELLRHVESRFAKWKSV